MTYFVYTVSIKTHKLKKIKKEVISLIKTSELPKDLSYLQPN